MAKKYKYYSKEEKAELTARAREMINKGHSQQFAADKLGVAKGTLCHWVAGRKSSVTKPVKFGDSLTRSQKESLSLVQDYMSKNPGVTQEEALKATGVCHSTYYRATKKSGVERINERTSKKRPVVVARDLPVEETTTKTPMIALIGEPKEIAESLGRFFK